MGITIGEYTFGPETGRLVIETGRSGAVAKAGHDLLIEVTRWHGQAMIDTADAAACAVLRGVAPMVFGAETRSIVMPVEDAPIIWGPLFISPIQLIGAGVAILFLAAFTWFFLKSRMGIAMRAVADNQQVAMAMGINVERYFALAWAMEIGRAHV